MPDRQLVTVHAEAGDYTLRPKRDKGPEPKIFPLMDVGNMNLQDGAGENFQSVKQRNRRMSKGRRINHNSIRTVTIPMNSVDQRPFDIRLKPRSFKPQFHCQCLAPGGCVIQRLMTIDVRFPLAEPVQVRSV